MQSTVSPHHPAAPVFDVLTCPSLQPGDGQPKLAGTWDWYGDLDPVHGHDYGCETFSIGVFQWVPRWNGRGTRRGTVVKRFRGLVQSPELVYERACAFVAQQQPASESPCPE